MVLNFQAGGAAINQIARSVGARLTVHPIALDRPDSGFHPRPRYDRGRVRGGARRGAGTRSSRDRPPRAGRDGDRQHHRHRRHRRGALRRHGRDWVGRGSGVDDSGVARKAEAVDDGLAANPGARRDPLEALRTLGGARSRAWPAPSPAPGWRGSP
jgi:nicotinate-nucleotide--dimethylbenzimidazole phosphoribosyltransferase